MEDNYSLEHRPRNCNFLKIELLVISKKNLFLRTPATNTSNHNNDDNDIDHGGDDDEDDHPRNIWSATEFI